MSQQCWWRGLAQTPLCLAHPQLGIAPESALHQGKEPQRLSDRPENHWTFQMKMLASDATSRSLACGLTSPSLSSFISACSSFLGKPSQLFPLSNFSDVFKGKPPQLPTSYFLHAKPSWLYFPLCSSFPGLCSQDQLARCLPAKIHTLQLVTPSMSFL